MSEQYNQDPNQPGDYQPNYNQDPNQPGGYQPNYSQYPNQMRGQQLAQTSMIFGIISLFALGIILGPIAIVKANQAEKMGGDAKVGKITGWIGAILGVVWLIAVVIYMIAIIGALGSMDY